MLVTKRMHPPVTHQGDVKKSASGKETHHLSTPTKKLTPKSKLKRYFKWKIGKNQCQVSIRWFQSALPYRRMQENQPWRCLHARRAWTWLWGHCTFVIQFILHWPQGEKTELYCNTQIIRYCNRQYRTPERKIAGC